MERHDRGTPVGMPQLDVAAALADFGEACSRESTYDLRPGQRREAWTHAAISTETMIGGSPCSGNGASSK